MVKTGLTTTWSGVGPSDSNDVFITGVNGTSIAANAQIAKIHSIVIDHSNNLDNDYHTGYTKWSDGSFEF